VQSLARLWAGAMDDLADWRQSCKDAGSSPDQPFMNTEPYLPTIDAMKLKIE